MSSIRGSINLFTKRNRYLQYLASNQLRSTEGRTWGQYYQWNDETEAATKSAPTEEEERLGKETSCRNIKDGAGPS